MVLCCGATLGRDLPIEGRDAEGIHLAMEFLTDNTRHILDTKFDGSIPSLNAEGKLISLKAYWDYDETMAGVA